MAYNRFLFLTCSILFFFSCTKNEADTEWDSINLNFETLFEVGTDSTGYLAQPDFLVTDSQNNIVMADRGRYQLLVYNSEGDFLHTIGEKGPGPAQFQDIAGLTINDEDILTVFDRGSQVFKQFNVSGEYLTSFRLDESINGFIEFNEWQGYQILFYTNFNPGSGTHRFMHIFTPDGRRLLTNAIAIQEFEGLSSEAGFLFILDTGSHLVTNGKMLFAPYIYGGNINEYEIFNNTEKTSSVKRTEAYSGLTQKEAVRISKGENTSTYSDATLYSANGPAREVIIHNQSKGLFKLNDGRIVHFTYTENEEETERRFGAEIYDENMGKIGYGIIKRKIFEQEKNRLLRWDVLWKDENDKFYISDKSENPKIRVVRLKITE